VAQGCVAKLGKEHRPAVPSGPRKDLLPERLLIARLRRGVDQKDVAEAVGCRPNTVGRWERGLTVPAADHLRLACDFLQVSADWVLGREAGRAFLGLLDEDVEAEILERADYKSARTLLPRLCCRVTEGLVMIDDAAEFAARMTEAHRRVEYLRIVEGEDPGGSLM
jgi:transcriptional regulator with XRE-family HTH domain